MTPEDNIYYSSQDISFKLDNEPAINSWLLFSIENEDHQLGELNFTFCSDDFLYEMNVKHLNHNTLTDIITFDYTEDDLIFGDIFISVDRVKENAKDFNVSFNDELHRVLIHGVLHLCGYKDKSTSDQTVMSAKEDFYLSLRKF